jgi:hypothetical protein
MTKEIIRVLGQNNPQTNNSFVCAMIIFIISAIIFFSPWLVGGLTIPWDAKAHFYPQFVFLAHALHSGQSPFWTPNVFAGMPQIADPQSLIFSPFFLILATLFPEPSFLLEDSIVFAMLIMGGLSVLAYFSDRGWSAAGGLLAALIFALGGSAAWRIQHTGQVMSYSWIPVTLLLLARAMDRRTISLGVATGFIASFLVLGRDQVAFLGVIFLASYTLYRCFDDDAPIVTALNPLLSAALVGTLLTLAPLVLTLELARNSNRPEIDILEAYKGSLPPGSFLTLISANIFGTDGLLEKFWGPPSSAFGTQDIFLARNMTNVYIGQLGLFILISGLWLRYFVEKEIRFFLSMLVFFILYALGRYTPAFDVFYHLPGVDLWRRPADATFLLNFIFSILVGYGFFMMECGKIKISFINLISCLVFLLGVVIFVALIKNHLMDALPSVGVSFFLALCAISFLLFVCNKKIKGPVQLVLIALLVTTDLFIGNGPNESTALPSENFEILRSDSKDPVLEFLRDKLQENSQPDRRDRVELAAIDFHWPNAAMVHGLDHDFGYNPIRLKAVVEATGAIDHLALPEHRGFTKLYPKYRSPLSDMLGLRFIATGVPIEQIDKNYKLGDFLELKQIGKIHIYENKNAFPRAQIVNCALSVNFANMIDSGEWPEADYHETVLLEEPPLCHPHKNLPPDSMRAEIVSYKNDDVLIKTTAPNGGGWLVFYDVWHPWWRASVDGAPISILRANVMFRAVEIPEGTHQVRFQFQPILGAFQELTGQ